MKNALIDAGPCIALFDRDDRHHQRVKNFFRDFRGRLLSSWPVVTETLHMLDFDVRAQIDFLRWLERGALLMAPLSSEDLPRIIELTQKYADLPMDFADATLILIAEKERIYDIITIDADFSVYRTIDGRMLNNLL